MSFLHQRIYIIPNMRQQFTLANLKFRFYLPLRTFSGGIEMESWAKIG